MFLILLDPPDSLLQVNYLQKIRIDHACLFYQLDVPVSGKRFPDLHSPGFEAV